MSLYKQLKLGTIVPEYYNIDGLLILMEVMHQHHIFNQRVVEEFIWQTGRTAAQHAKFFHDGIYVGKCPKIGAVLAKHDYEGPLSAGRLSVQFGKITPQEAIAANNLRLLRHLRAHRPGLFDRHTVEECTYVAAAHGHFECLSYLFKLKAPATTSVAAEAARENYKECMELCFKYGVEPSIDLADIAYKYDADYCLEALLQRHIWPRGQPSENSDLKPRCAPVIRLYQPQ